MKRTVVVLILAAVAVTAGGASKPKKPKPLKTVTCCDKTKSPSCEKPKAGCCSGHGGVCWDAEGKPVHQKP